MSANRDQSLPKHVQSAIAESSQVDYDGHTEFARMTPSQRLAWLDQTVLFIHRNKRKGKPSTEKVAGAEVRSTEATSRNPD